MKSREKVFTKITRQRLGNLKNISLRIDIFLTKDLKGKTCSGSSVNKWEVMFVVNTRLI